MKKINVLLTAMMLLFCTACSPSDSVNTVQIDWNQHKVYQWQDYYNTREYPDSELRIRLADFPDTVFIWRDLSISSYEKGKERHLIGGMPVWNAFFTDLNFDGFPELCTTVSMGSGIIDEHIVVYDYHNQKVYILEDRMKSDYTLYLDNDELYVRELPYIRGENMEANTGRLAIENEKLVMKQ